jgi:hypothetical protein
VAQAERRLARVDAGPEQLELEDRLDLAGAGRDEALHAEPALADAREEAAVLAELALEGGQLGRAQDVEPGGIVLSRLISHVQHREAVDVQPRLGLGGRGILGVRERRRRQQQPHGGQRTQRPRDATRLVMHTHSHPPCHFGFAFSHARTLRRASSNRRS